MADLVRRGTPEGEQPSMEDLIELCERLDEGLQLATRVIAELDVRVRKLEIAERKRERKITILKPSDVG